MRQRYRRGGWIAAVVVLVVVAAVGLSLGRQGWEAMRPGSAPGGSRPAAPSGGTSASPDSAPVSTVDPGPATGPGTFTFAAGTGGVHGAAGTLRRFAVAVEDGIGQDPAAFAGEVDKTFADPRGWTADGQVRFQRVPGAAAAEFTVYLATPATSEAMCAAAGLHTARFTSCRLAAKVVINLARWQTAIPDYGAPLADYRAYAINHEVGHQLGGGHESCPGPGRPAPVMQQQTLGLKGCVANAWPIVGGQRYQGAKIP